MHDETSLLKSPDSTSVSAQLAVALAGLEEITTIYGSMAALIAKEAIDKVGAMVREAEINDRTPPDASKASSDDETRFERWARTCDGNCNSADLQKYPADHAARTNGITYQNELVERDYTVWMAAIAALSAEGTSMRSQASSESSVRSSFEAWALHSGWRANIIAERKGDGYAEPFLTDYWDCWKDCVAHHQGAGIPNASSEPQEGNAA